MGYDPTSRRWETFARQDPLWAILTSDDKRGGRWKEAEFFATGEADIAALFAYLAHRDIAPIDHDRALDFGCGVGRLTRALAARFGEVHGIDVSPTMVELADKLHAAHSARAKLSFIINDKPNLRVLPSDHYSFTHSRIVLQHISYPASVDYIREMMRVTKPGGLVVFQIPTEDRTWWPLRLAREAVLRAARLAGRALMEMNAVARVEIERVGRDAGCELLDAARTNAGGALDPRDRGERIISMQFVFRRTA